MRCAAVIFIPVPDTLETRVGIKLLPGCAMNGIRTFVRHPVPAVCTKDQSGQPMGIGAVLELSWRTLPQLLRYIPDFLRDNGLMGISENNQLILRCLAAFLNFEILADRLSQNRVSQIFLTIKNIAYSRIIPSIRIMIGRSAVILRMVLLTVCGRNQYSIAGQSIGDFRQPGTVCRHVENPADNGSSFFIYI